MDCDLDIEPTAEYPSEILEEFAKNLYFQTPQVQVKILRAVSETISPGDRNSRHTRTQKMFDRLLDIIVRMESSNVLVDNVVPKSPSQVVRVALEDAEHLISRGSAPSAVAKTHTALHGYLKQMCDDESIVNEDNSSLPKLFKLLQANHSAFQSSGLHQEKIDNVGKGLATAIHSLNEIRNQATDAHANDELLDTCDASLSINAIRTIFHYVEEKRSPRGENLLQTIFSRR